jgi:SAM-dependent methyltransferase
MEVMNQIQDEQVTLWNGVAGRAWVDTQAVIEEMYKPLEELLVDAVPIGSDAHVLDVGCGTGSTTLAAARRIGNKGSCVGIDISEPMIAAAQARAERERLPARFIAADAQTHAFEPASVDLIMSRFGVMFFGDFVEAFANLRRAARSHATLRLIVWRSAAENPFMTTAERAAAPLQLNLPARQPGPGQFAFADRHRVNDILQESGWREIEIQPIDVDCSLPETELVRYLTRMGPLGRVLVDADDRTRARVIETVRPAFDPYVHGSDVRFTAACWLAIARTR